MITLSLSSQFQSFTSLNFNLPDFTILTGINGARKTQLLLGIEGENIQVTESGKPLMSKKYVNNVSLNPDNSSTVNGQEITTTIINNQWTEYNRIRNSYPKENILQFSIELNKYGLLATAEIISSQTDKKLVI